MVAPFVSIASARSLREAVTNSVRRIQKQVTQPASLNRKE
jgi:hypothetical protein